jgi:hypothetical protein
MTTPSGPTTVPCKCSEVSRLDDRAAEINASGRLRLSERGRDSNMAEDYQCDVTATAWVLDFPFRHWTEERRGTARLRRLPLGPEDAQVGGLD